MPFDATPPERGDGDKPRRRKSQLFDAVILLLLIGCGLAPLWVVAWALCRAMGKPDYFGP